MKQTLIDLILCLLIAAALAGCSGKKLMKNCEHKGSRIYECEDL